MPSFPLAPPFRARNLVAWNGIVLAVLMSAASVYALTPAHLAQMPSVAVVDRKVLGSDPLDTAARHAATFKSLLSIVRAMSVGGELGNRTTPDEAALIAAYGTARDQAARQGRNLLAAQGLPSAGPNSVTAKWMREEVLYQDTEAFRRETLLNLAPSVEPLYERTRTGGFALVPGPLPPAQGEGGTWNAERISVMSMGVLVVLVVGFVLLRTRSRLLKLRRPIAKARNAYDAALESFHLSREDQVGLMDRLHGGDALSPYVGYQQSLAPQAQGGGAVFSNVQSYGHMPSLTTSQSDRVRDETTLGRKELRDYKIAHDNLVSDFNYELGAFPTNVLAWAVRVRKMAPIGSDVSELNEKARKVDIKASGQTLRPMGGSIQHAVASAPQSAMLVAQPPPVVPAQQPYRVLPAGSPESLSHTAGDGPPSARPHGAGPARGGDTTAFQAVPATPALRFLSGPLNGQRFPLPTETSVVIGRDPASAQIVVADGQISAAHASIAVRGPFVFFMDRGSTNGSSVNGAALPMEVEIPIKPGDIVALGRANGVSFVVDWD